MFWKFYLEKCLKWLPWQQFLNKVIQNITCSSFQVDNFFIHIYINADNIELGKQQIFSGNKLLSWFYPAVYILTILLFILLYCLWFICRDETKIRGSRDFSRKAIKLLLSYQRKWSCSQIVVIGSYCPCNLVDVQRRWYLSFFCGWDIIQVSVEFHPMF